MKLMGKLIPPRGKKNKYWSVEVPILGLFTEGKSKSDAFKMVKDAIASLVNKKGFRVICIPQENHVFTISSNNSTLFLAFILSRLRTSHCLTARQVAAKLSSTSPNAYARYEQGKAIPKISTLEQLLKAIDPDLDLILVKAA